MQPRDDISRLDAESGLALDRDQLTVAHLERRLDGASGLVAKDLVDLRSGNGFVERDDRLDLSVCDERPQPSGEPGDDEPVLSGLHHLLDRCGLVDRQIRAKPPMS